MSYSRTRSAARRVISAALVAALALGGAGCAPTAQSTPGADPSGPAGVDGATAQLGQLTVAQASSMKGYSREHFPHWRDAGKNCDVRDTVLQRDGEDIKLAGCNVVGGRWTSVYDKKTLTDPADVDIDHMVPLANAWRSGADEWSDAERGDFANDLTRPQLLAVSAGSNRGKGDQGPEEWQPPNRDYWCTYAESWITVKHHWKLTVTAAEKTTLTEMLGTC
ncbi:HNH endonuclease family protein [Micromonospora sp. NBC_01796]|uniref:HNH endonuclease family protein n=1 Tax=Micromonospora sp. NBC_01796 TaxID=2975987 RepID=UPI002DD9F8ED|nr:HNH endonuclease family protein [Micromonospora sp. NBC_01796]WSA88342.1 HNH endonuclease family protein [Micromonospora sp. NBC_01796]